MWYLDKMEALLSEYDKEQLKAICSPKVVAIQPEDSRRSICVIPDGEIRCYGSEGGKDSREIYISSRDGGLSWKKKSAVSASLGAAMRIPDSGRYVTVIRHKDGTYAHISELGPDDTNYRQVKISDQQYFDMFQPKLLCHRRRLVVTMHLSEFDKDYTVCNYTPVFAYSDDDGESWRVVHLKSAPRFVVEYPHLSPRWENNGAEPSVTELPDGRLMLIARTSLDYLYVYYSSDGGESWSDGEPSDFHCTLTTPFFLELSDGRTVFFWNNTRPLPEPNKSNLTPPQPPDVCSGLWEDVFTNRDACHAAISNNCSDWEGLRELYLNDIRNEPDFRSRGGLETSYDRSVHQFQAIELPYNRILVAFGQNEASRRMAIFAADWLLEGDREEYFEKGLTNVSTQLYIKSFSGTLGHGHCAWNRTDGALLVPSPDGKLEEALQVCRIRDERLYDEKQGVVWNFPKSCRGELSIELTIVGSGLRVCLCDHWLNPCDRFVPMYSQFAFELTPDCIGVKRTIVTLKYDINKGYAEVYTGNDRLFGLKMLNKAPNGLSYLHLQTLAEQHDPKGSYLHSLKSHRI